MQLRVRERIGFPLSPFARAQVIMNGLTNAAKYGPQDESAVVDVVARPTRDGALAIEVLDRGRGLQARPLCHVLLRVMRCEKFH